MLRWIIAAALAAAALPASAQPFPSKTVHLIVAYAAGGTGDLVARIVADKLGPALGQSVVVENRAGASGAIGATAVVICFGVIAWRGLRVALRAPDTFGAFLALGLTTMMAVQALGALSEIEAAVLQLRGSP